jgi:protein-tyrosine phosphatase
VRDIYWVGGNENIGLAIVLRPRGDRWLEADMRGLKAGGIQTLVSLLEPDEARWLGLEDEAAAAERAGITFLSFPIPDAHVPMDEKGFRAFVADLAGRIAGGEHIGVHCQGSIGRATVTAASTLVHLGWKPADALEAIETARGVPVPDTEEQFHWILAYEARH